jgi:hypothetical protein
MASTASQDQGASGPGQGGVSAPRRARAAQARVSSDQPGVQQACVGAIDQASPEKRSSACGRQLECAAWRAVYRPMPTQLVRRRAAWPALGSHARRPPSAGRWPTAAAWSRAHASSWRALVPVTLAARSQVAQRVGGSASASSKQAKHVAEASRDCRAGQCGALPASIRPTVGPCAKHPSGSQDAGGPPAPWPSMLAAVVELALGEPGLACRSRHVAARPGAGSAAHSR